jgi:hypothetical protein
MATWKVEPTFKKSVIERNYLTKDGNTVMVETGWRWGEFLVYTDDDNPPNIESGVDIYDCDYETELVETFDGCWEDVDYDDCDDETREWLEEFFEENSWLDLEEHGWSQDECEMIIDCDLKITKVNDDGIEGEEIITGGTEETTEATKIAPGSTWPFANASEPVQYATFKCTNCDFETEEIDVLVENPNDDDKGAFLCPVCGSKVEM